MTKAKINVLLLSAGRRVELLQAFRRELTALAVSSVIYAGDLHPSFSAACQVADESIALPRVTSPGYTDYLLNVCVEHGIGLVIPTIDTELLGLAQARARFETELWLEVVYGGASREIDQVASLAAEIAFFDEVLSADTRRPTTWQSVLRMDKVNNPNRPSRRCCTMEQKR